MRQIKRNSLKKILNKKNIVCLTAYTSPIAKLADKFADVILVGDSLGPVLYGFESTRNVDLNMMIKHARAVVNNTKNAFIVVDMPYGSYEHSKDKALQNAKEILASTGAMAVKLEGGEKIQNTIKFLTKNKIKVMGHLGMLPQSLVGKPRVFGKTKKQQEQLFNDIISLQNSGVFAVVIECTYRSVVEQLIKISKIPLIGIGASPNCAGQIVVTEDILGMTKFSARFSKKYFDFFKEAEKSLKKYSDDIKNKKFPTKNQCY